MRVVFTRTFNYRWPSRAITEFKASPRIRTVKKELGEAALEVGAARKPTRKDEEEARLEAGEAAPAPEPVEVPASTDD